MVARRGMFDLLRDRIAQPGVAVVITLFVLVGPLLTNPAQAKRGDPLAELDRDQRRVFQAYTRLFCTQFFRYGEDRYVILPNHYRKRQNSNGRTVEQAREEMTEIKIVRGGGTKIEKKFPPPKEEVIATSLVLPQIDVGHYGKVYSVRIDKIVGDQEMIVKEVILFPASQKGTTKNVFRTRLITRQMEYRLKTYRVLGFSTKGLSPGQVYRGPKEEGLHVAVMSTDLKHHFVMVNYDKLNRVRTTDFHKVLAYVKLSPTAFIDMVRSNKEQHGAQGNKTSLISMYRRFYNRYRPNPKVSVAPPQIAHNPPKPVQKDEPKKEDPAVAQKDEPQPKGRDYDKSIAQNDTPDPPRRTVRDDPEPAPATVSSNDDWDEEDDLLEEDKAGSFFGIPF